MKKNRLMSRKEVADLLGCSQQTVSNWIKDGLITGHKTPDGAWLIDRNTIEKYFDTLQDTIALEKKKSEMQGAYREVDSQIHEALSCMRIATIWGRTTRIARIIISKLIPDEKCSNRGYRFTIDLLEGKNIRQIAQDNDMRPSRVMQIINKFCRGLYGAPSLVQLQEENKKLVDANNNLEVKFINLLQAYKECSPNSAEIEKIENPLFSTALIDCDLTVRCLNCMRAADVHTIGDLVSYNKDEVLQFRNLGKKSLIELEELLLEKGLKWGMNKKHLK